MILPCGECKGRCCTFPVFSAKELQIVRYAHGVPNDARVVPMNHVVSYDPLVSSGDPGYVVHRSDGTCPWLIAGACSIYQSRPKVCRDYGKAKDLPCEYLYPEQAKAKHDERLKRSWMK